MFVQRSFILSLSKELNRGNLSFAQFFLLGYLAKEDYLTTADIAKKMGHSTAAATGLVDRLQKLGYVQCFENSEGWRKARVQITRKGLDFVDARREDVVENMVEVMADMFWLQRAEIQQGAIDRYRFWFRRAFVQRRNR